MPENNFYVHSTAIVEENVQVGKGVNIWHYCHVRKDSVIGANVSLGKGVFIDCGVSIGTGSRIQNGVNVYNGVNIKEWVFIGPNVTFTNDKYPRAGSKGWKLSETFLMPGCSVGAGSVISSEITIGSFALIGAGSVVMNDILPFHLAYGLPAKQVSKICACGNTRVDFEAPKEEYIKDCCLNSLRPEVIELAKKQVALLK